MKNASFPSITEILITAGKRSWTFNRSIFSLISPKIYYLNDTNFFTYDSPNEDNVALMPSKAAGSDSLNPKIESNPNQTESSNLDRKFTIKIPSGCPDSCVDSIIKFIYHQVSDINEDNAIDIYCLSHSLGLTEVISKSSSYIIFKFTPKRIIDAVRSCWKRQIDSGPFDRAIESRFPEFISFLHNLPSRKIFNMLRSNHLKVSQDSIAHLISTVASHQFRMRAKKEKETVSRDDEKAEIEEEEAESKLSSYSEGREEEVENEDENSDDENYVRYENQKQSDSVETDQTSNDDNNEDDEETGVPDSVNDIFALTDFVRLGECSPTALCEMFTNLSLLKQHDGRHKKRFLSSTSDNFLRSSSSEKLNQGEKLNSSDNLNVFSSSGLFGKSEFSEIDHAMMSSAMNICAFAAFLLKQQIEMKKDCKQMLSSLEKSASGVAGAAEYQLAIENERGFYTKKNLQAADKYEQVAIEKGDPEIVLKIADKYYDVRKDRETAFALYSRLLRPTDTKRHKTQEEIKVARSKCGEHISSRMDEFLGPNNSPDAVSLLRLAISQGEENCCVYGYEFSLKYPNIIGESFAMSNLIRVFGDFIVKIGQETIASHQFEQDETLKSACIPPSVKSISDYTFSDCVSLEKIFIPPIVESIDTCAFNGCSSLIGIRLPRGLKRLGESSFNDCNSLKSIHVAIGCKLEKIEYGCFNGCFSLETLELPETLVEIGENAFFGCENLTSLRIPSNVKIIHERAFMNCRSLERLTFDDGSNLEIISDYAFSGCVSLVYLSLPSKLKTIGDSAFENCESLQELHISFGIETIGNSAFYRCESLKKLELPPSLKYIRDYAFYQCHSLKSLVIPLSLREIGNYVFYQSVELEKLAVGSFDHLNLLFNNANKRSLKYLKILSGPVSLNENQISNFKNLTDVEISSSVQRVMKDAFSGCPKIKNVVVETKHTMIDKNAFDTQPIIQFTN